MNTGRVRLSDRFDLSCSTLLLNGTQALVRLMLLQSERDRRAGLNTAGYVTGYRGSPLGAVDMQMTRAQRELEAASVRFEAALNEDLAATALWGAQQSGLRGEGRYDGVFGLWYGKGPGVDRSGDVLRHANMAGVSRHGGVLMALGDDHTGESSTTLHQSEWTLVDSYIPILSPAGVQEILDFGVLGYALSRFSGNWVGLKCMKETVESTSVVDGRVDRMRLTSPQIDLPPGGINIRLIDSPRDQEARVINFRRSAAESFAHANQVDRRVYGKPGATIGFVAAGKNWLDLQHALDLLGIDSGEAERLGITAYKVGMTWPLDERSFRQWAAGLELIVVVEEKRKLIEAQIKEAIFDDRQGRRVYGRRTDRGGELFQTRYALDPVTIARKLGSILVEEGRGTDRIAAALERLDRTAARGNFQDISQRLPYFCSGCPHNSSTKVPDGSRAYAGIGCHYMVQWMDRDTVGFTQMGGEGANWIGEAPFSRRGHVFQNLGDGTYNHSGIMAVRAAVAANVNITFKLLFNDAVAMTGGQINDGGLTAAKVTRELEAIGVRRIAVVYDEKEDIDLAEFPSAAEKHEREALDEVQRRFRDISGVTAIVYVQTCAAEKRRRRKRGLFPDPDRHVFINTDVCEGCGDCGVQSNCVSIVPVATPLGRKRAIDHSSCNKDFSCLNGFCPSFVTLSGTKIRDSARAGFAVPELPEPEMRAIRRTFNMVIAGVGGTGVVTIGAIVAMAAHIDGKGAGMIEMAGLAQKGGAVHIHCRLADKPQDISAIRVADGEADCVIGGDLVVTASAGTLELMETGRTRAVVNSHEINTGDFTRDTEFRLPMQELRQRLEAVLGAGNSHIVNASTLARNLLGDSIYANMLLLGAAWQSGCVPLRKPALEQAIGLNGAAAEANLKAFEVGRWTVCDPEAAEAASASATESAPLSGLSAFENRKGHLRSHSGDALAARYENLVKRFPPGDLRDAAVRGYHKALAIKDEFEVARLLLTSADKAREEFEDGFRMSFHLAPPILPGKGTGGRPRKRAFGMWILSVFRILARMKGLRGTPFDPFGYSAERRGQREMIRIYESDMDMLLADPSRACQPAAKELARLPLAVRGFGPVWAANHKAAMQRRDELLRELAAGPPSEALRAAERCGA